MRYQPLPKELYIRNRSKLVSLIEPGSVVVVNANDEMPRNGDQTFLFRQNSDLFYLTGLDQEKCVLLLCPSHPLPAMREVLFTVKTSDMMVIWNGHKYTHDEVRQLSGIENVKWLDDFEITLRDMLTRVDKVYVNQNEYPKFTTEVASRDDRSIAQLHNKYPAHRLLRLGPLVTKLRQVKEPEEIAQMQKACHITRDGFLKALKALKPGMKEYELEAVFTQEFIRQGANGHAYPPIVACGESACVLHYNTNHRECKDGELVLLDIGAEYGNYASDMSRTIPVNGKFSPRQRQVYEAVLRVLRAASAKLLPGTTIDKWHAEACQSIETELLALGLISRHQIDAQTTDNPAYFKYYMHGTGHFLGLDVHDVGTRQDVFVEGMVLTCEPAIYIQEEGIGIRLENDFVVAAQPIDLMADIPIEPDEIERLMALQDAC